MNRFREERLLGVWWRRCDSGAMSIMNAGGASPFARLSAVRVFYWDVTRAAPPRFLTSDGR
jgi:hypothetical protein